MADLSAIYTLAKFNLFTHFEHNCHSCVCGHRAYEGRKCINQKMDCIFDTGRRLVIHCPPDRINDEFLAGSIELSYSQSRSTQRRLPNLPAAADFIPRITPPLFRRLATLHVL